MSGKKVVVGMSGGVDSSVAACLLKEQGFEVIGVTMEMWSEDRAALPEGEGCHGLSAVSDAGPCHAGGGEPSASPAVSDAARVAEHLGIPHYTADFKEVFRETVVDYFVSSYLRGETPNPCIACNRFVKWEALLSWAERLGADFIATGHYARIDTLANGRRAVRNSVTAKKDQTYALYRLTQEQLSRTLMPVGAYTKEEIRDIALSRALPVAGKPDSQEICFIPDQDYAGFICRYAGCALQPGDYVDPAGNVLGRHRGIIHYTIGQRKGLGLSLGRPAFVTEIRPETGQVVIGGERDVFTDTVYCTGINFMALKEFTGERELTGKVRYGHRGTPCRARMVSEDLLECRFREPVRAVTPGQALVLYDGEYVAGGGTIVRRPQFF